MIQYTFQLAPLWLMHTDLLHFVHPSRDLAGYSFPKKQLNSFTLKFTTSLEYSFPQEVVNLGHCTTCDFQLTAASNKYTCISTVLHTTAAKWLMTFRNKNDAIVYF